MKLIDPVLEKYKNDGFGKNAFGWYFNPWIDEYDENYDPHNDKEYNEKLNKEIKWHPKLTKDQIEELIEEGLEPGDNEYDMYLWNHGINPFEEVGNKPDQGKTDQGKTDQGKPDQGKPDQGKPDQEKPNQGKPNVINNPKLMIKFDAKQKAYILRDETNKYETNIALEKIEESKKYQEYINETKLRCEGADLKLAKILNLYDQICKNKGEKTDLEYTYLSSFDLDATPEKRKEHLLKNNISIKYDLKDIKQRGLFKGRERREIIKNAKSQYKLGIAEYEKPKSRFSLLKERFFGMFNKNRALGPGKDDKFIDEKDYTEEQKDLIEATKKREKYKEYLANKADRMYRNGDQVITPSREYREAVREQDKIVKDAEAERYGGVTSFEEIMKRTDPFVEDNNTEKYEHLTDKEKKKLMARVDKLLEDDGSR